MEKNCKTHGVAVFVLEGRGYYRCRACRIERVLRARQKLKTDIVALLGGSCSRCGYDTTPWALQCHHPDPATKTANVSRLIANCRREAAMAEARKCVLLCANCHAEVEHESYDASV